MKKQITIDYNQFSTRATLRRRKLRIARACMAALAVWSAVGCLMLTGQPGNKAGRGFQAERGNYGRK